MNRWLLVLMTVFAVGSQLSAETKLTENLWNQISGALESNAYIDAVVLLERPVTAGEEVQNSTITETWSSGQPDKLSPSLQEEYRDVVDFLRNKVGKDVWNFENPDRNGRIYLKALPGVLLELSRFSRVVSVDIVESPDQMSADYQGPAEIPFQIQPLVYTTGRHQAGGVSGTGELVYSGVIKVSDAPWIRLLFSEADLGRHSYVILTSLHDNAWQRLTAVSLEQWQNSSAYFNGNAVKLELYAVGSDRDIFLEMKEIMVGEWAPGALTESICGPTDDRIPSNDPATGRVMSIGCTGWIIASGIHVTAGHCSGSGAAVLQFNVPLSLPSGTVQNPGPQDQYSVDVSSKIWTDGGIGNDWGVFEVFDNSNTGLQPIAAQGAAFIMAQDFGPDSIRITGYGVDDGSANQTQQTHVGPNAGSSGTTMRYRTDTEGGNSGSPVIDALTGFAVGVHTHGGCTSSGGNNNGTSTFNPDFWAQVRTAAGIPPVTPYDLSAYSDYQTPTSMQLTWEDPVYLVNGDTLLSSDFSVHIQRDGTWIDSVSGGTQQYTDSGLNDGQLYFYSIYARLDSAGWRSDTVQASWIAGGSPVPSTPSGVGITNLQQGIQLYWHNPAQNIDGTPMDDLAGINLYLDDVLVETLTRTSADSGRADSTMYVPATGGFHSWYLTSFDNENPSNESEASAVVVTPLGVPVLATFSALADLDSGTWKAVDVDINDRSVSPPSGPLALNFNGKPNGADSLELYPTDLRGYEGEGLVLSYYYQPQGQGNAPEPGDSLKVEFLNSAGEWIVVRSYPGSPVVPFVHEIIDLDSEPSGSGTFYHSQFQLRLSSRGLPSVVTPNDDWFVDDLYFGIEGPLALLSRDSVFFDTTGVGTSRTDSLWVVNQGLDSLHVTGIVVTNGVFSVESSQFVLDVGDSLALVIRFTPVQGGVEMGWLRMLSDHVLGDTLDIYVEGIGEGVSGIAGDGLLPRQYSLSQNYPNPFNPVTWIHYELPVSGEVRLEIYNILGQRVRSLVSSWQSAGRYDVEWRGENDGGLPQGSGIYIYRFRSGDYNRTLKMMLMK